MKINNEPTSTDYSTKQISVHCTSK